MAGSNNSQKLVIFGMLLAILMIGSEPTMINGQIILCNVGLGDLMTCKPFANGHVPQLPPSSQCCSVLQNADLDCLCGYQDNALLKRQINTQQAMALPALCGIKDKNWHCQ